MFGKILQIFITIRIVRCRESFRVESRHIIFKLERLLLKT